MIAMVISSVRAQQRQQGAQPGRFGDLGIPLQAVQMLLDAAVYRLPYPERQHDGDQECSARRQDTQAKRAVDQPQEGVQAVELQQSEDAQQIDRQAQRDGRPPDGRLSALRAFRGKGWGHRVRAA